MLLWLTALEWVALLTGLVLLAGLLLTWRRMVVLVAELETAQHRGDQLESLLELVPLPLWLRDAQQQVTLQNAEARALNPDYQPIARLDRPLSARALEQGRDQTTSLTIGPPRHGQLYALSARPLPRGDAVLHVARDMSAIEALQAELARHVAAQSEVLEHLHTAIAIFGADRRLKYFNSAYARLWRLEPGWLADEPSLGEVLEAQRERRRLPEYADFPAFKREQLGLFQDLTGTREDVLHLPDDTTLRVLTTPHPMGGLVVAAEDVTDALALERSYNTLIEVQRETLDNLAEGVALFGPDHRLRLHNAAFARLWGMETEWLAGRPVLSQWFDRLRYLFLADADWQGERDRLFADVGARRVYHTRLRRPDGRQLDVSLAPLPDGSSFLSSQDITDREQTALALAERNEALETADRLKTEFIANMSYELRTPLNTIIGFADIMANNHADGLSPRQMEYANGILESSQRLLDLISDILDLASVEAGHLQLELEEVDLHALLAGILGLVRGRARSQQLQLHFDCPPSIGKAVLDPRRIRQSLFHLLSNACKFTAPGGQVRLGAQERDDGVMISVSDTGIGIPEADQARVFDRFERGVYFGRQSGAGLGLSLVRSFVELHGGHISLESAEGTGTSVQCWLPRRAAPLALGDAAR